MTASSIGWPYPFDEETCNEDWVKTLAWDFSHYDGSPVDTFDDLFQVLNHPPTENDVQRVLAFTRLPAWLPAPQKLKTETARWLMEWNHPAAARASSGHTVTQPGEM